MLIGESVSMVEAPRAGLVPEASSRLDCPSGRDQPSRPIFYVTCQEANSHESAPGLGRMFWMCDGEAWREGPE